MSPSAARGGQGLLLRAVGRRWVGIAVLICFLLCIEMRPKCEIIKCKRKERGLHRVERPGMDGSRLEKKPGHCPDRRAAQTCHQQKTNTMKVLQPLPFQNVALARRETCLDTGSQTREAPSSVTAGTAPPARLVPEPRCSHEDEGTRLCAGTAGRHAQGRCQPPCRQTLRQGSESQRCIWG